MVRRATVWAFLGLLLLGAPASRAWAESITFVVNANLEDRSAWERIAADYTGKTGVRVELLIIPWEEYHEKLSTMIASGTAPDILFYSARFIASLAASGAFENHQPYAQIMRDGHDVFPAGFDEVTLAGELYGIPSDLNVSMLAYNADLFAAAGLVAPPLLWKNGEWTWAAFLDAAKRLTQDVDGDGRPDQAGTQGFGTWAGNWPVWFWANGADILDAEKRRVVANSPEGIEALTFATDLALVHAVTGGRWQDGTTGLWITGLNNVANYRSQLSYEWDIVPFPIGPSGRVTAATYFGGGYAILRDAPNKEAAYAFLDYLTSREVEDLRAQLASRLPIKRDGVQRFLDREHRPGLSPANLDLIVEIIAAARPLPITPVWNDMERIWWEEVRPVMAGQRPANYALQQFALRADPVVASW